MCREWGVDHLPRLGRALETIALADASLSALQSTVNVLDEWRGCLPVNETQVVCETAAWVLRIRDDLREVISGLGGSLKSSRLYSEDKNVRELKFADFVWTEPIHDEFSYVDLKQCMTHMSKTLANAESVAIEMVRNLRALVESRFPGYGVVGEEPTPLLEGAHKAASHSPSDNADETEMLAQCLEELLNDCEADAGRIQELRKYVDELQGVLSRAQTVVRREPGAGGHAESETSSVAS